MINPFLIRNVVQLNALLGPWLGSVLGPLLSNIPVLPKVPHHEQDYAPLEKNIQRFAT